MLASLGTVVLRPTMVATLLSLLLASTALGQEGACNAVNGVLGKGSDLHPVGSASSSAGCCDLCRSKSGCKSWTYHPTSWAGQPPGVCVMHSAVGSLVPEPGAISGTAHGGPAPGPPACSVVAGILGFGSNLRGGHGTANSTGGCCEQCRGLAKCKSWTYHAKGGSCFLHGKVGTPQPVAGAVSGTPHGPAPQPAPAPPPALRCLGEYLGCFKDFVPAPGVPPVRALGHLAFQTAANMSVARCAANCSELGYPLAGVTVGKAAARDSSGASDVGAYSCWCGCAFNAAAPALSNSSCAAPCAGAPSGDGPCGTAGAMATFRAECVPIPPPSKTCGSGNGSKPLPPGPACSQAAAKQWKFCDSTLPLDDRVTDLVSRITLQEAGGLLTARESPAIPRLGIPCESLVSPLRLSIVCSLT